MVASAVILVSGAAVADSPFTDIDGNTHAADIEAVRLAGITSGCTTTTYCPSDEVKRDQMATFLARAAGLSTASAKHFPVMNARGATQSYCSFAQVESEAYRTAPCRRSTNTLTASGAGTFSSIAIGADELPLITYKDNASGLKLLHCGNSACTAGNNTVTFDANSLITDSSIAIGTDGMPLVAYGWNQAGLRIAHCNDVLCASHSTILVSSGNIAHASMAVPPDGLPVVAYQDVTNGNLLYSRCSDAVCSAANAATIDNSANDVGDAVSLAIGADGVPNIAYTDSTSQLLRFLRCGNTLCSSGITITTPDSTTTVGETVSLTIGADALPIMTFRDATNDATRVLHCSTTSCLTGGFSTYLDNAGGTVGNYSAIVIGTDGLPVVFFSEEASGDLRMVRCFTRSCDSSDEVAFIDSPGNVGTYVFSAVNTDGSIITSYYDATNSQLKVTAA